MDNVEARFKRWLVRMDRWLVEHHLAKPSVAVSPVFQALWESNRLGHRRGLNVTLAAMQLRAFLANRHDCTRAARADGFECVLKQGGESVSREMYALGLGELSACPPHLWPAELSTSVIIRLHEVGFSSGEIAVLCPEYETVTDTKTRRKELHRVNTCIRKGKARLLGYPLDPLALPVSTLRPYLGPLPPVERSAV